MTRSLSHTGSDTTADIRSNTADSVRVAGFFPGLGSRSAYQNLGSELLDSGIPEIGRIYRQAAAALGFPGRPGRLLLTPENLPADRLERQGFIGAALVTHNLAVDAHLRHTAKENGLPVTVAAYTGESFGILTAAIASGSLSVPDGVRIAQAFTPLLHLAATGQIPNEAFANELAAHLPHSTRGTALVPEPFHVVALKAPTQLALADALDALRGRFTEADVEPHKSYSPQQANLYVRADAHGEFTAFARSLPEVEVEDLKEPTVFLAHSARMRPAREALEQFLDAHLIGFSEPVVPVVANHTGWLLTTGKEIRDAVLAMTDEAMASQATVENLDQLVQADMVLELGPGGKSLQLLADNRSPLPAASYTATPDDADHLTRLVSLTDRLTSHLEKLHDTDLGQDPALHDLLRDLFRLVDESDLADQYVRHVTEPLIARAMLRPERTGTASFYRLLETFQHTYAHRAHIGAGELVQRARLKKRHTADPAAQGRAHIELQVLTADGTTGTRTLTTGEHEVVVFHFDSHQATDGDELARSVRQLLGARPLPSSTYDEFDRIDARIAYSYLLFEELRHSRPAVFAHDFYLAGSAPTGWSAALAASGSLSVSDAARLHTAAAGGDTDALHGLLTLIGPAEIPVISPQGVPVQAEKDLRDATRAVLLDGALEGPTRRIHLNGDLSIVSLGTDRATTDATTDIDAGSFNAHTLAVPSPAAARTKGIAPELDAFEYRSLLTLTDESHRIRENAQERRVLPSTVASYIGVDESLVSFGKGGSESMTMFVKKDGEQRITVRKILSEALTTAHWSPDGAGVMLAPFAKARKQAEYLQSLPAPVGRYFPEVFGVVERQIPIPAHQQEAAGRSADREVIYEMSYVDGEEVSRFVEKQSPPPAVIARLYEQIVHVLNDHVHSVNRVPAPGDTLDVSYFKKIEDRLELSRRTAPATFSEHLIDTERIVINGTSYLNHQALLERFRGTPEFRSVLEPAFHSLVMGDTNTENIKMLNVQPLLHAQHLIEDDAPQEEIDAALQAITAESLGIKFLDPRAIGFKGEGAATRDDAMYDNKPWHNSIGHYDEMHFEHFTMNVDAGPGKTPQVTVDFEPGNPYQLAYRVRDVVAGGGSVDPANPQGMEDHFATVMTRALGLDDPDSPFLRDDPYWIVRFVFMMGQHFTAMPPFHFQAELDGTLPDSWQTQRRPVAIYCEGIKWLNWALEMLEGKRTEFLGLPVPPLPHLA
ncbi:ACP S-malonyltransferase [Actinomycetota bacterium Odt1-20B]